MSWLKNFFRRRPERSVATTTAAALRTLEERERETYRAWRRASAHYHLTAQLYRGSKEPGLWGPFGACGKAQDDASEALEEYRAAKGLADAAREVRRWS